MLKGRDFTIFTDHKPLPWSACQQRHLSYLAEFTSTVVQVPGLENVLAVTLYSSVSSFALVYPSTPPPCSVKPGISGFDISLLPPWQLTFPFVSEMKSSPSLSMVSIPLGDFSTSTLIS